MSEPKLFGQDVKVRDPYSNTKVSMEKSQIEIQKLLADYGADPVRWTTSGEIAVLEFGINVELHGVRKNLSIRLAPPAIKKKVKTWNRKKSDYDTVWVPDLKRGMRMLYFYLKTKLESIHFGLVDASEEFLSNIVMNLPGGRQETIGAVLTTKIARGSIDNILEDKSRDTIPERREEDIDGSVA